MHTEQGRLPRYQSRILKGKWEFSRQSVLVEHLGEETMMDKRAQEKELMGFFLGFCERFANARTKNISLVARDLAPELDKTDIKSLHVTKGL